MAMSELDNLKSSRRIQAQKNAEKVRKQPVEYVPKSVQTQNEGIQHQLTRQLDILNHDLHFRSQKLEVERRQFVIDQRRVLKPAIDNTLTHGEYEGKEEQGEAENNAVVMDLDSDLMRIVEYYEIHKPNTVKRIHTVRHLNPIEEKKLRTTEKLKMRHKAMARSKLGSNVIGQYPAEGDAKHDVSASDVPKHKVPFTHRGDMTEKERSETFGEKAMKEKGGNDKGFYLSTGTKTMELDASMGSSISARTQDRKEKSIIKNTKHEMDETKENRKLNVHTKDENQKSPIPLFTVVPPIPSVDIPDKRFQSPPSTKKFRNYKVRTALSDRPGITVPNNTKSLNPTPTPRLTKSHTPFSDDLPAYRFTLSNSANADFKSALTESNLQLHTAMRNSQTTPRPAENKRALITPSIAESIESLAIEDYDQYLEARAHMTPHDVQYENEAILGPLMSTRRQHAPVKQTQQPRQEHNRPLHETILENPRKTKPKFFRSKRYGDSYLVPSDVKRTCADVPFDPYVLALHQKEVEEIETKKKLKDIDDKLNAQRKNTQFIQSNVNDWVRIVEKSSRAPKRINLVNNEKTWKNIA